MTIHTKLHGLKILFKVKRVKSDAVLSCTTCTKDTDEAQDIIQIFT